MFQNPSFCGGFDATEQEFTFSFYDEKKIEWWFQMPLQDIEKIAAGKLIKMAAQEAI